MGEPPVPETTLRSERGVARTTAAREGLEVGTSVGRYVVLGQAGVGGFGTVYRAYDPELDRRVALKVLDDGSPDDRARKRLLLGEARALAKLRHANIVAVYDVGEHGDRGFVAMEYVDGVDLAAWLSGEERSWPATASVMAKAARGLAAAHAEGIVHRDFKPSNVLVDARGEAYVVDFGLAHMVQRDPPEAANEEARDEIPLPSGTPPFLAPELYDGVSAGPRSDVFAYCVTLWQAAYGALPWSADDEMALLKLKRAGVPASPKRPDMPARVVALLRAGLAAEPEARPASPTVIADALDPDGGRRIWGVAAVAGLAAVAVLAMWVRAEEPCADVGSGAHTLWNKSARAELAATFAEAQVEHADETWSLLQANVDTWVQRWQSERDDACRATHVRHEQSPALLDRRMACLDRELSQMAMLLQVVGDGDAEVARRAPRAVATLGRACDVASIRASGAEASGPQAEAVLADLDRVVVLEMVARYDDGLDLARDVEQRAGEIDAVGLQLRAKYRRARLLDLTGDAQAAVLVHQEVHWDAEAQGWDDVAAKAGLGVMYEYAAVLDKPEVALAWAPHVGAAIRRAGDDARHRATLIDSTGIARLYLHEIEAARDAHLEALEIRESYDEEGLDTVATLQNLGIAYEELRRYDDAIALHERALGILVRLVGEHHPHTARVVDNLGTALLRKGDFDAAVSHLRRALDIRRSVLAAGHRSIALSTVHLAHAALLQDDVSSAIEGFEIALRLYSAISEPQSRDVMLCHEGLAHAYQAANNSAAAKRHAALALAGLSESLPEDHPELVGLRAILADEP
ncbi:MAG: serine/threonine protein kinase [Nannocystaceae bacterium]|nr:serine/threonine protein kinase [Nannocystaceae bacterium]